MSFNLSRTLGSFWRTWSVRLCQESTGTHGQTAKGTAHLESLTREVLRACILVSLDGGRLDGASLPARVVDQRAGGQCNNRSQRNIRL